MSGRATTGVGVLVLGVVLSLCPVAMSSASAASHHPGTHPTAACGSVIGEQSSIGKLGSGFAKALESRNFATAKADLLASFGALESNLGKLRGYVSSAPANVRAALTTVINAFNRLRNALQNANSFPGLEAAFSSFGQNAQLANADETLASYYGHRCGLPGRGSTP